MPAGAYNISRQPVLPVNSKRKNIIHLSSLITVDMKALLAYLSRFMNKSVTTTDPTLVDNKPSTRRQKPVGKDDWNGQWLGEEMRPFNSMGS
jgi:hypothetical protein